MAVTKYFNRTSDADYAWLGARLNNPQYDIAHNTAVNDPDPLKRPIKDDFKYYAHLPANLNYSTTEINGVSLD